MRKEIGIVAFLILTLLCNSNTYSMKKQQRFIELEPNLKLWVETYGIETNDAVLFISGAGANSSFWSDRLCSSLVSDGLFVIKYNHRDFGYSIKIDWEQNPYDVMRLAEDEIGILDYLKMCCHNGKYVPATVSCGNSVTSIRFTT